MSAASPVVVVGAGLAGLAAAVHLTEQGRPVRVFEASDGVGGRVRTDVVDGFQLDRGFQVFLTAYPEARRLLDLDALDLGRFLPGALVRLDGAFHVVADPVRRPGALLDTLRAPVGGLRDKVAVLALRRAVARGTVADGFEGEEREAADRLASFGLSDRMVRSVFRPLLGGITLDPQLRGSSHVVDFVLRMLAEGDAAVPAAGMGAIPRQLADRLPVEVVHLGAPVAAVRRDAVELASGEVVEASDVVVATDMSTANRLAGTADRGWQGVTTLWFAAPEPPVEEAAIVLDGDGRGPVLHLAVLSQVSPGYAPAGRALVAASVVPERTGDAAHLDDPVLEPARRQLTQWFGDVVRRWELLRTDRIAHAQPRQPPGYRPPPGARVPSGVVVAGDHRQDASINGALWSGRRAAEAVLDARLDGPRP